MERRIINPWSWQDQFGFVQASEIRGVQRELICAGQASMSADGQPLHPGDMRAQLAQALDNLETVLRSADFELGDVVRLNIYTTDVDRFFEASDVLVSRSEAAGCRYASTLVGVTRLAFPELLVELEATAAA
jgi:enamine deaminase RidA (YjgF/YER057c/UK114 family)